MTAVSQPQDNPRRRPKDRKQQIILQARDLFVERGYPNVSMALIAERVGITAGALYRHFENKQVLLEGVMRENFSYLEHPITADRLDAAMDDAIELAIGHPYVADLWTDEARYLPDIVREELRGRMRAWARSFITPLRQQRSDLDAYQEELIAWGIQSVLACLGNVSIHLPSTARRPVIRAAALSLARTRLLPRGPAIEPSDVTLRPASTRERLLLAAIEQFAERGYQETSMTSIGAAADVTGPNLYGYFESKADLARAVHERGMHTLWLNIDGALSAAHSADEALERLVRGHVGLAETWSQIRMDLAGTPELGELNREGLREYVAEWVAIMRILMPEIEVREARLRVLIALKVINDLPRTPRLAGFESFQANLTSIALAILLDGTPGS